MRKCILTTLIITMLLYSNSSRGARPDGYWQQEVNYVIDVTLKKDVRTIEGNIEIEYINNSPDQLPVLYLKAFPNAIQDGSYADNKRRSYGDYSFVNMPPANEGRLDLRHGSNSDRPYSSFEMDNTIIIVNLKKPIMPGDTLLLNFGFTTVLPSPDNMRMGVNTGTTKAAYWYPQVCVYDRRMGWVNSQYLGWGECYGDFGKFDVTITAPEDQIVAATGVLVNSEEALPAELSAKLHMSNFMKPRSEWPELNLDPEKNKSWHYFAENTNDFAWTTSNNYCIDSGNVNGVAVVAYALRFKAKGWETAVQLGKEAIETFSELYYPYQWPVMRICDAFGGMEYPMITNCGGSGPSPQFSYLLYHEVGHEWFMGQVGSNQVDRPFLDEGFTTHLEHVALEKYYGRDGNRDNFTNWYQKKFAPSTEDRDVRGFLPLQLMIRDGMDKPGLFSYDQGEEYFPHRVSAYYKSAAMHYSLRSILGDSAYFNAMHSYCQTWFFGHPYEEDFTHSMEEATGLEFDHYLEQWYHNRHRLDYAFAGQKSQREGSGYAHTIKLRRNGRFVAPVDVAIIWEQGDTSYYTVAPEGMQYAKAGYTLTPVWNQFRRLQPKYEFTVQSPNKIKKVVIDPDNLLVDVNRMNNESGLIGGPVEVRLDNILYDYTPVNKYALRVRPDFWYDQPNGAQIGIHAHGSYLQTKNKFSLYARFATESKRPVLDLSFSTPFKPLGRMSESYWRILRSDRRTFLSSVLQKKFTRWHSSRPDHELVRLELNSISTDNNIRSRSRIIDPFPSGLTEAIPDGVWDGFDTYYSTLIARTLKTFRLGSFRFNSANTIGVSGASRNNGFTQGQFRAALTLKRNGRPFLFLRGEAIYTSSLSGEPPAQFLYHLSRARSIDRFTKTQLFRSPGSFPNRWEKDFYLSDERVRGYQDRVLFLTDMAGGSVQVNPDLIPDSLFGGIDRIGGFLSKVDLGFFAEGAWIDLDGKEGFYTAPVLFNETGSFGGRAKFYASAGASVLIPSLWFGQQIRLDFPFYLNRPLPGEDKFKFRFSASWVLPVGS